MKPKYQDFRERYKNKPINRDLCVQCKSWKLLCKRTRCPLIEQIKVQSPIIEKLKKDLFSPSPPSFFVGWKNYPKVAVGPMALAIEYNNPSFVDNPREWYGLCIENIINYRSMLVRSKMQIKVNEASNPSRDLSNFQELVLSTDPVDVEMHLNKKPKFHPTFSEIVQPIGPSAFLKKFEITENVKIPHKVDYLYSDTDVKANNALCELYKNGYSEYYLTKLFSAGVLGTKKNRRLVPTRWAITAVDDIIGTSLIKEIRTFPEIDVYYVYHNEYLGNHYEILFIPGCFEFEVLEAWCAGSIWGPIKGKPNIITEYEGYKGRKQYAIKQGGGYYAARLPILEKMKQIKQQAKVVIFREIYEDYYLPVGVWEVKENVRIALENKPIIQTDLESALNIIFSRLRLEKTSGLSRSTILSNLRQKTLRNYIKQS
ncbi:MAG: Nre family DNA repair protein [Methanosarcinales archaeon]